MRLNQTVTLLLGLVLTASFGFCAESHKMSETVLSAKTVTVIGRATGSGGGKNSPNAERAKSQVEKELQKWAKYQIVDTVDKADLVLIVVEGYVTATEVNNMSGIGDYAHIDRPDVLSDTLSVYKGGAFDEASDPLWRGTVTTDDYPSEKVAKKFRKDVEKASK